MKNLGERAKWMRVINENDKDLVENMQSMSNEELKLRVLQSQRNMVQNERDRAEDEALAEAKQEHDDRKKPYDDAKKFQNAISRYGMLVLEERGVSLGDDDDEEETEKE